MTPIRQSLCALALLAALHSAPLAFATDADTGPWPDRIVTFEDLKPLTGFRLRVPGLVVKGRVVGPAVVRAHVDATGTVVRTTLMQSSGNADLDESTLHAMRVMKFEPYLEGGTPAEVTLVVPVHVPKRLGRSF